MQLLRFRTRSISLVLTTLFILLFVSIFLISFARFRVSDQAILSAGPSQYTTRKCTPETAVIRRDWNSLTHSERLLYINAVKCLQEKPSTYPFNVVPASLSFYDDFVAVHINNTPKTHKSAIFLPWHRHFNVLFEKALHEVCDYPALLGIPYWNWPHTELTDRAELFGPWVWDPEKEEEEEEGDDDDDMDDGMVSPKSILGSPPAGYNCLDTGAFANSVVRFGPIDVEGTINDSNLVTWTNSRPHCLARDLDYDIISAHLNQDAVSHALAASSIDEFSLLVAGSSAEFALHGWAHKAVGGQMADSFCASADPIFHLHHSMVDRLWNLWQEHDATSRRFTHCCEDSASLFRDPDVPAVHNETKMSFGVLGPDITLQEVADTMTGGNTGYCYLYK